MTTEDNIRVVEELIRENDRNSCRVFEDQMGLPKSTVHEIITEKLGLMSVAAG